MLADPLPLYALPGTPADLGNMTDQSVLLRTNDIAPGRSVRIATAGDDKYTMTISHSESKENVGQVTDRTAVRLERRKTLEDGRDVTTQATLTVSTPRDGYDVADALVTLRILLGTLLEKEDGTEATYDTVTRVLNGEP